MRKKIVVTLLATAMALNVSACAVTKYVDKDLISDLMSAVREAVNEVEEEESRQESIAESITESVAESIAESETEVVSEEETDVESEEETIVTESETEPEEDPAEIMELTKLTFVSEDNKYKPMNVEANAPEYSVKADLSNIENLNQFTNLTKDQKAMIAKNGFVVVPTDKEQLFYIYEDNTYKQVPSFITADSVLQLYHIYYDYALRNVEADYFYDDALTMNQAMLKKLMNQYEDVTDEKMKSVLKMDLAYFTVSAMLLDQKLPGKLDSEVKKLAQEEYDLIMAADDFAYSPIFGYRMDYSLFTVRGHYTRSEELQKYFRAFIWYGVAPFALNPEEEDITLGALTVAATLEDSKKAKACWSKIYATTGFMVGQSDDVTPLQLLEYVKNTLGKVPNIDEWTENLDALYANMDALPAAQIVSKQGQAVKCPQMRFMGQRYIPDSEILQNLCDEYDRPVPTGLDVMAVYGSEQAEKLLEEIYRPTELWSGYADNYAKMAMKFRGQSVEEQTSNVYTTWLYILNQLNSTKAEGYPFFMQNEAWRNKSLTTSLGSWAELRHDTILYGKQSGAECGGGDEPPQIMSYVEPDPEFFNRLYWLTETTKNGLKERGMLSNDMDYKTDTMLRLLEFLRNCAEKELRGEDLSAEDRYSLLVYGGTLEYISSSIAEASDWYMIESETDRNMAVVADVHTTLAGYLEEAVGSACEIYVAIPQDGKVYLTRGAVFDYYEFMSPTRLQDETWQKMLKEGTQPERVPYANTFLNEEGAEEMPLPDAPYSTGC